MVPPEAPQAVSIGLRNCYVGLFFQLPSQAPQAVSLGLRSCYVARFGYPLKASKASKAPQQLPKAFEPQTLRSSLRRRPACFAMVPPEAPQAVSIGLRNCYVARFQLPSQAPQAVSLGLRNCYVARFGYPLKASKASKAPQHPYPFSRGGPPQNVTYI